MWLQGARAIFLLLLSNLLLYVLLRVTAIVDQMKMFGTAAVDDGKMPLMITSQDEKSGTNKGLLILNALSPKYSMKVTNHLILKVLEYSVCLVLGAC